MKELLKAKRENKELRKENLFLKKNGGILCKGNQLEAYQFIDKYHTEFEIRWLLVRLGICPNAYYNYRKHRKADYYTHKSNVLNAIDTIYHEHKCVDGYRSMRIYLEQKVYCYSLPTIHKYMNTELGLKYNCSIIDLYDRSPHYKQPGNPYIAKSA